ncbi:probable ADP-ribosylation factor GTPase-activating protein AGD14 isoform X2 [Neltuma alba]|uniref:probable ADP-ribosylation factor GTPase-activating protein AGD14 isoform X2 n=1 Tax=Neltuma alba TaxID=207710 RepID=UPI0010A44238|nr:probable ADP-ribosylation factor GTPase-activating protein AGD14 isoform X2 [Prosopis alba]
MANRLKEDEKNERIIRGLLKLPANRRCINCDSLGPQYVCTNFMTFVCTTCGGIHREFTHRVKSISMAKFTSQEVSALQEGGNQHAKEVYFKEWDPKSHSLPDNSNVGRLRNFIKQVYVDKRFTGERTYDKSQRGDKDNFSVNSRVQSYQGDPKSPPYDDKYKHRYSDSSSPGGRSPGYDQESRQYSNDKRNPSHPPINDWHQEDRFGDGRRFEGRMVSDGDYKLEGQLPGQANNPDSSSPPVVRSVRDILGENAASLQMSKPSETNSKKANDGSALTQRTVCSSSLTSNIGNPAEAKLETPKSLIDFGAEPEPPLAPAITHAQQTIAQSIVEQPNSSDVNNWASFDVPPEVKATQTPSNVNSLESMLSQLSVSSSSPPAHASQVQHSSSVVVPIPGSTMTLQRTGNLSVSPAGPAPAPSLTATVVGAAPISTFAPIPSNSALASHHLQPLFPPNVGQSSNYQSTSPPAGALNNQPWGIPPAPTMQGHPNMSLLHVSHVISKPATETSSNAASGSPLEVKPSGRKELPEDLFTVKYSYFPAAVPGWQMIPSHGMGTSMPYNAVPMPSLQRPSKSTNPFDIGEPPVQTTAFALRSSLQGALPGVSTSGLMPPLSLSNPSLAWNPPGYGLMPPQQMQPHPSAMTTRPYMGQLVQTNMAMPRHQEIGSFGAEGAAFGFSNLNQHLSGTFSASASSNLSSAGRNPFG